NITATYNGDDNLDTSTSTAVTVTVNSPPVTDGGSFAPSTTPSPSVPVHIVTTFGGQSPMESMIFNNLKTAVLTINGQQIDLQFSNDHKSIQLPDVPAGTYELKFGIDFGMDYLAYDRGTLTVDANGNATITLIDPYGVITDSFTGKPI